MKNWDSLDFVCMELGGKEFFVTFLISRNFENKSTALDSSKRQKSWGLYLPKSICMYNKSYDSAFYYCDENYSLLFNEKCLDWKVKTYKYLGRVLLGNSI